LRDPLAMVTLDDLRVSHKQDHQLAGVLRQVAVAAITYITIM